MESFKLLQRRTTDLLGSMPQHLPSLPNVSVRNADLGGSLGGSSKMKGTWEKVQVPALPRSSHSVDVVAGTAYIFGGEVSPHQPVDNTMHAVTLPGSGAGADHVAIKAKAAGRDRALAKTTEPCGAAGGEAKNRDLDEVPLSPSGSKGKGPADRALVLGDVPAPRAGHATGVIGHRIFLFGGRGGPDMAALDEGGRVWVFDTRTRLWSYLDPAFPVSPTSPVAGSQPPMPAPRSSHSAVATDKPNSFNSLDTHRPASMAEGLAQWAKGRSDDVGIPQRPIVGHVAETATDSDADGYGTLIIHGGCLAAGRSSDVWAFDVRSRIWKRLPDAPGNPRSGTALAVSRGRLYRFGGFNKADGEEGGQLDFLELAVASFDDVAASGEVTLVARGNAAWQSLVPGAANVAYKSPSTAEVPLPDNRTPADWPGHRSVAGMEAVTVGGGREYVLLMLGERTPSRRGHERAGQFWDDVWAFQVPSESYTAASLTDTVLTTVGRTSREGTWVPVQMGPCEDDDDGGGGDNASAEGPGPRGWLATSPVGELERNAIVLWGGLNAENTTLGDGWILRLA